MGEWESGRVGEGDRFPHAHSPTLPLPHSPILPFSHSHSVSCVVKNSCPNRKNLRSIMRFSHLLLDQAREFARGRGNQPKDQWQAEIRKDQP